MSDRTVAQLAATLVRMRARSRLTQAELAERLGTTQTAIARLESGRQSPSVQTLQRYAHANGFCVEIGFIGGGAAERPLGTIVLLDDEPSTPLRPLHPPAPTGRDEPSP